MRQIGASFVAFAGLATVLSGLVLNPLVASWLQGDRYVDSVAVLRSYFVWSMLIGFCFLALGLRILRGRGWADNAALTLLILGSAILADRFLLTRLGITMWTHDSEVLYKHRPNIERSLAQYGRPGDRVVINQWGFHGPNFPEKKPDDEARILVLGDSITMGYGLTYAETFSNHLERLLTKHATSSRTYRVINTGVHGYSTAQQRVVLERSFRFAPDYIIIGFCMNDITEPFLFDRSLGGTGLDYHGVWQVTNPFIGWLANDTGFGRLTQVLAERKKNLETEKRQEVFNVRQMAGSEPGDSVYDEPWSMILKELEAVYELADKQGIPVALVIFPFDFQLLNPDLQKPQRILSLHAEAHDVPVVDMTDTFRTVIFDDKEIVDFLQTKGKTPDEIRDFYRSRKELFYFDDNHFTEEGHRIIADAIHRQLQGYWANTD